MMRTLAILVCASGAIAADRPPSPFVDRGACPFECCTYRRWRALKRLTLVDRPDGTRVIARLREGEWVNALTGETRSVPIFILSPMDVPGEGIRKGDGLFVLHYEGEGVWAAWFRGKVVSAELPLQRAPKTEWWAKVRTASGVVGWVRAEQSFENQDACG